MEITTAQFPINLIPDLHTAKKEIETPKPRRHPKHKNKHKSHTKGQIKTSKPKRISGSLTTKDIIIQSGLNIISSMQGQEMLI